VRAAAEKVKGDIRYVRLGTWYIYIYAFGRSERGFGLMGCSGGGGQRERERARVRERVEYTCTDSSFSILNLVCILMGC
jgi:hypothetical protein